MRKIIRIIISFFGYDFIKINKRPVFNTSNKVKVGQFIIEMPSINPLIKVYQSNPLFNSELTRIVEIVFNKYNALACVDVGANTGDTAALIKSFNDSLHVICIEGDSDTFKYLKSNTKQFKDVSIYNKYLGEREEIITVNIEKKGWNSTIINTKNGSDNIQLTTLSSILLKNHYANIKNLKFLKIDTEGFDTIILRGAIEYIKIANPIIYLEYNRDNMDAINEKGLDTLLNLSLLGYEKILFFDDNGRFIIDTELSNIKLIEKMHRYVNGKTAKMYYYNICLIHKVDKDIAIKIIENEYNIF